MIAPQELRLGNITNKGIIKNFYESGVHVGYGKCFGFNEIEPIELTEEWLLKLGFEKKSNYQYTNKTFIIETWISRSKLDVRLRQSEETSVIICEITFVHQLQNLFFALTGEELTIK